jgi:threonine synthase
VAIARGIYDATLKSPKVICAQPIGCGPISRFLSSELNTPSISACNSIISGLQLPTPPDGELAADAVRRTDGWSCLVEDEEAFQMQDLLSKKEGIFVEPASALALTAMINDFRSGRITKSDNPVAILTGTGLKDLRRFAQPDSSSTRIVALKELKSAITTAFN